MRFAGYFRIRSSRNTVCLICILLNSACCFFCFTYFHYFERTSPSEPKRTNSSMSSLTRFEKRELIKQMFHISQDTYALICSFCTVDDMLPMAVAWNFPIPPQVWAAKFKCFDPTADLSSRSACYEVMQRVKRDMLAVNAEIRNISKFKLDWGPRILPVDIDGARTFLRLLQSRLSAVTAGCASCRLTKEYCAENCEGPLCLVVILIDTMLYCLQMGFKFLVQSQVVHEYILILMCNPSPTIILCKLSPEMIWSKLGPKMI